ncbi:MAG: glycosyltransferase family 4 protein, partial [Burkholderiales bacterium]
MKILMVTHYFWPESFRINDLAAHFASAGHKVTVLTGLPNYPEGHLNPQYKKDPDSFIQYGSVDVCRVPHLLRGTTKISLVLNFFTFLTSASVLGSWKLRRTKFDVVFVFAVSPITVAIPAIVIGKLNSAPVFLWVQDLWPETLSAVGVVRSPRLLALVGKLVRWIYARCDHILIQSQAFAPSIRKYCSEADQPGKMLYLPNWAEEVFGQVSGVTQHAVTRRDDLFTVMFAGNIGEAQDFPALLDAAERLKSNSRIRWIIIGDGRMREWVGQEVTRRGLADCFQLIGRFPVETMPAFFECADVLLVSLKTNEIFSQTVPGKVQSYLASGRPVVGMLDGEA